MSICFIADVHLSPLHPERTQRFEHFLQTCLSGVQTLYILGDLFDAWVGETFFVRKIAAMLRSLKERKIDLYVMRGNRDFLMQDEDVVRMGGCLIPDPYVIDLYGIPTLLKHGDDLCADWLHLIFRRVSRYAWVQTCFLNLSLPRRQAVARAIRGLSRWRNPRPLKRSDVSDKRMKGALLNTQQLIHGHTHQPTIHEVQQGPSWKQRFVLSDWHEAAHSLHCYPDGRQCLTYHRDERVYFPVFDAY